MYPEVSSIGCEQGRSGAGWLKQFSATLGLQAHYSCGVNAAAFMLNGDNVESPTKLTLGGVVQKTMKNIRIDGPKDDEPDPPLPTSEAIARLWSALDEHVKLQAPVPERTARLVSAGDRKMAQKLVEEAGEAALAAILKDRVELVRESADLIYHLTLLWASLGIRPDEIWAEMTERESAYGLAEKRAKPRRVASSP